MIALDVNVIEFWRACEEFAQIAHKCLKKKHIYIYMFIYILLGQDILKWKVNQSIEPNLVSPGVKAYSGCIYLSLTWHMSDLHKNVRLLMLISYQVRKKNFYCHLSSPVQCTGQHNGIWTVSVGLFFHVSPCCLRQPAVLWASGGCRGGGGG